MNLIDQSVKYMRIVLTHYYPLYIGHTVIYKCNYTYRERWLFIPGIFVRIIDNEKNGFLEKYDILPHWRTVTGLA